MTGARTYELKQHDMHEMKILCCWIGLFCRPMSSAARAAVKPEEEEEGPGLELPGDGRERTGGTEG